MPSAARSPAPQAHTHGQAPVTAVLLCNLGTPEAPTPAAVRRYLAEFLSDPRVVEIPRAAWLPILYGLILPLRSAKSAAKYATIWTPDGSPLKVGTIQSKRSSISCAQPAFRGSSRSHSRGAPRPVNMTAPLTPRMIATCL